MGKAGKDRNGGERSGRACYGQNWHEAERQAWQVRARNVSERSVRVRHGIAGSLTAWRGGAGGARNGVAL